MLNSILISVILRDFLILIEVNRFLGINIVTQRKIFKRLTDK